MALLNTGELNIHPASRTAEIVARVQDGLSDIPISRYSSEAWGINIPGDSSHVVYVWVDALFNYLTAIDTDELRHLWPATLQVVGKDILWFHAVIWPAMLLALKKWKGTSGWIYHVTSLLTDSGYTKARRCRKAWVTSSASKLCTVTVASSGWTAFVSFSPARDRWALATRTFRICGS
ncbi:class I tRNA ligase family protein [Pseudomonas shirazica]|nr:class I tRNA ligase family protein [Pseudomonas shirazica]